MTNQIGNGSIPLRIGNLINTKVYGGPYLDFGSWEHIPGMFGVKMAEEIEAPCHVDVPTRDYHVPQVSDLRMGVIKALMAMINDQPVYVGCWGGIGRTGLFLAALAKVQIEYRKSKHRQGRGDDPVLYVRKHFIPHALETQEQMDYIENFDVSDIVDWLAVTQQAMGLNIGYQPKEADKAGDAAMIDSAGNILFKEPVKEENNICCPTCKYMNPADGACDCCGSTLTFTPTMTWIPDEDKVGNPAFAKYCQPWKEPKPLVERDADWMDKVEADSASEFIAEDGGEIEYQEQIDSLQSQLDDASDGYDDLDERVTTLMGQLRDVSKTQSHLAKALHALGKMVKMHVDSHLTKPTIRERIRSWIKDSTYDGM